jgi:delta-aminolevulinic acid dehydratase/porphobilinogen synthase
VSGEYGMIKAAAEKGVINEKEVRIHVYVCMYGLDSMSKDYVFVSV